MKTTIGNAAKVSRRKFIVGTAAAGGGLALGFRLPALNVAQAEGAAGAGPEVTAWVVIKPDDTCVIRIARSEMGQGTLTGLAQLVAEELDCDWQKVTTEQITPGQNLARKRPWGDMSTGGSRGIRGSQDYVRRGGAAARMMLMQAAANEWNVPVSELTVSKGVITHDASKRSTTYGKVAEAASKLEAPDLKSIKLRDPKEWKIAGKPVNRLDTAAKLNGSKVFAIDVNLPGMLCAAIKDSPVFGGKVKSYDEAAIANRPGFRKVVKYNDNAVVVVADTWWHAKTALDALPIVWDEGPNANESDATIAARLKEGLTATETNGGRQNGDALKAIAEAPKKVEAVYSTPFLAHACMEPMNCTARITADKGEVWVATQNAEASLAALSKASGLPLEKCEVYRSDLGGGFGRRGGAQDYVHQAVAIAKEFPGTPVKLIWSREEDMAHDFFRPISMFKGSAGLDANGNLVGLHMRVSGQSINAFSNPSAIKEGKDMRQLQGYYEDAGRCAVRLQRAELSDRLRDAEFARAGRPVARSQYQPKRRLPGMLHRRGGAGGRQGLTRIPPRAYGQIPEASRRAQCRGGERRMGKALASRHPSRNCAVHGLRFLFRGHRRGLCKPGGQGQGSSHGAGAQLWPCGQSLADRRTGRRLCCLWPERRILWRVHSRQGADDQPQLRQQ